MSRQNTERAPVCFQDVTACFSEVEWKLLHEWQKELYRNVMKDIHQALVALGPLIASSIFALRAEEKEPALGNRDSLTLHRVHHFSSDSNFHSDLSVGISQEKSQYLMETQNKSTGGVSLKTVHSPNIKENKETYFHTDLEGDGRSKSVGSMLRRVEVVKSVQCTDTMACKTAPGEDDLNVLQISENGKYSENHVWSKSNLELMIEDANKCECSFSKPLHSNVCQVNSKAEISETYDQTESVLGNAQLLTSQTSSLPNPKPCTYTDYGKSSRQNKDSVAYPKTQIGEGDNIYLFGDSKRSQSMGLQKMQYKEREYQCADCDKSFMRKHHLKEHQRIHSGEKPYVCTICGKDFCRSGALNRHVKTHNFPDSMSSVLPGIECMQKGDPTWSL
ncbi:zinc finger protein 12-like isoform X2 [Pleurodeles waltl]